MGASLESTSHTYIRDISRDPVAYRLGYTNERKIKGTIFKNSRILIDTSNAPIFEKFELL